PASASPFFLPTNPRGSHEISWAPVLARPVRGRFAATRRFLYAPSWLRFVADSIGAEGQTAYPSLRGSFRRKSDAGIPPARPSLAPNPRILDDDAEQDIDDCRGPDRGGPLRSRGAARHAIRVGRAAGATAPGREGSRVHSRHRMDQLAAADP